MREKAKHSRTRYRHKPRRLIEEGEGPEDWQPEDPINGPGLEDVDNPLR